MLMNERVRVPDEGLAAAEGGVAIPPELAGRIERVLIPESILAERIGALSERICLDYRGADRLTLIAVLEGARRFAEDLGRVIARLKGPALEIDYIKARTYGEEIKGGGETTRKVNVTVEPRRVEGKHILVVEDIVASPAA
jgi:hypoxanthine-guanine phosphoribosyltransferase